jgi:hypothetical protein
MRRVLPEDRLQLRNGAIVITLAEVEHSLVVLILK